MSACERCWSVAKLLGIEYTEQLQRAADNGEPCIGDTVEAERLRAGQWWDEATQSDSRRVSLPGDEQP